MERKKKREKPLANGSAGDGLSGQSGDANGWQREGDRLEAAKRVACSANSDSTIPHGVTPAFNCSLGQHSSLSNQQQYTHAPSVQSSHGQAVAPQQQAQALQIPLQGCAQSLGGCQNQDAFVQTQNVVHPSFQTGATESSWPHPTAAINGQGLVGRAPAFPFPPPPYSGPWDPVAWWGHHPYQLPFPYLNQGYGSYSCPMPLAPPIGAIQRGVIKPPAGLSQKHIRIWEAQSLENMQLWTTTTQLWAAVARSDAEIALQRTKILKLEAELLAMKVQREGNTQSDVTAAHQFVSRRGRRKKVMPAPTETMMVSAAVSGCNALSEPASRARTVSCKDGTTTRTEMEDKSALTMPEQVYRPSTSDCNQKSSMLTVNPSKNEISLQKHSLRQTLEFQSLTNNSLTVAKDDIAFGRINHLNSPFKPNNHMVGRKDGHREQNLNECVAASFSKTASKLDHQNTVMGDMPYGASINSGSLYPECNGNLLTKEAISRSQFQAHFNAHSMESSIPHEKAWQYTGEDGSDEQDEGGISMQDDGDGEDVDDGDDENVLDDIHSEKVSSLWHTTFR